LSDGLSRRALLRAGGLALAGPLIPGLAWAARAAGPVEIGMVSGARGAHVAFDPVGVLVEPGTTIRFVLRSEVHTATAYHPANDRPLRIPEGAEPWDSGYLTEPGAGFEVTLQAEGVYDFLCRPHEAAGMVGRIVVGRPAGPATAAPGEELPAAARQALPAIERIMAEGMVRAVTAAGG
jgi:plastocyanin